MKYFYHYSGFVQIRAGEVKYLDGTCTIPEPINSHERYAEFKEGVARETGVDKSALTISSLALLHTAN